MTGVHLYTADMQPATRAVDYNFDPPMILRLKPRARVRCWRCLKVRWAKRCYVQVSYDAYRYWCRDRDCKKKLRRKQP